MRNHVDSKEISYVLLVSLLAVLIFHFLGLSLDWYNTFWWYDIPMHIAGGAWIALVGIYILDYRLGYRRIIGNEFVLVILSSVFIVGVFWELFEYSLDVYKFHKYTFSSIPKEILTDSFYDIINDVLGAVAVFALFVKYVFVKRTEIPTEGA